MKKSLLILLVFLFSSEIYAQTWCPPGATWYYRKYDVFLGITIYDGTIVLRYTDTVRVNSILCKEIIGTYFGKSGVIAPPTPTVTINNYLRLYTYENNGIVRIFNQGRNNFDTLANFKAKIGDSWLFSGNLYSCTLMQRRKLTVIDSVFVIINGQILRKLKMIVDNVPSQQVTFIEKIGGVESSAFEVNSFLYAEDYCSAADYLPVGGSFSCYSDTTFPLYSVSGNTNCVYNAVSIPEGGMAVEDFKIFPNPGNGLYSYRLGSTIELSVLDMEGRVLVKELVEGKNEGLIDLRPFPDGLYFLKIFGPYGCSYSKLVKAQN